MTGRLSRRAAVGLGAALAAGPALGLGREARAAVRRGGKLIYARRADSLVLDPVFAESDADIAILPSFYDTLLAPVDGGKGIGPGLATGWAFSKDAMTLTLTLRQGVRFADGTYLNATDVKWSLDRARNPGNGAWAGFLASIVDVAVARPDSIAIRLDAPDPSILAALAAFNAAILPAAKVEAAPGKTAAQKARGFALHPVGTGPFALAEWKRGEVMLLRRNPYYWKRAPDGGPLPYVEEVELPIIPDDVARVTTVKSGAVHGTEHVPFAAVKALLAEPQLAVHLWPAARTDYLALNCRPALKGGRKNPMGDVRVRQALNHAVSKKVLVDLVTANLGTPATSFLSAATPMHAGHEVPYPFDQALAKKLLAEAGFASGFELSAIVPAGDAGDAALMSAMQRMWGAVGVKLKLEPLNRPALAARYAAGDYEVLPGAWADTIADPAPAAAAFAYSPDIACLHSGWKDPTVDFLFVLSQKELDPAKRAAEYRKLQEIYVSEAPIVFLYETPYRTVWRKPVNGFVKLPTGGNLFAEVSL